MKELTREEAIRRHRQMWSWIASETLRLGYAVSKSEALQYFKWPSLHAGCWLCEFNGRMCEPWSGGADCIIQWPGGRCSHNDDPEGLYTQWLDAHLSNNATLAAELAQRIAMLPAKEESDNAT